jgi:hypothetical protein
MIHLGRTGGKKLKPLPLGCVCVFVGLCMTPLSSFNAMIYAALLRVREKIMIICRRFLLYICIKNPFLSFISFHTLPPLRLYIFSLVYLHQKSFLVIYFVSHSFT